MLYIGNFSYTDNREDTDNICLMPLMVEADDADAALERFSELLRSSHKENSLLHGANRVYLESLEEFDELPTEPVIVQWQKVYSADDGLYSVISPLPGHEEVAEAYAWSPDEEELVGLGDDVDIEELADEIADTLTVLATDEVLTLGQDFSDDDEAFLTF